MLVTRSGKPIPSAAIGGMKWTSNLYGTVDIQKSTETLEKALQEGFFHIDTADCYLGSNGNLDSEAFIGAVLKKKFACTKTTREEIFIASKCGIKLNPTQAWCREVDISPEYIITACEASLNRLKTPYLDLFYLHRINEAINTIEESMQAISVLLDSGKIRYVGLSEANTDIILRADYQLRQLTSGKHGISAIQTEYNFLHRGPENDGVFCLCHKQDISFFAYSPLCRGLATDVPIVFSEHDCRKKLERFQGTYLVHNQKVMEKVRNLAQRNGYSLAQLAIAWFTAQTKIFNILAYPIFGTANPRHLHENIIALKIKLDTNLLSDINYLIPFGVGKGLRYPDLDFKEFKLTS
jgi:aryl-alcohol dehydrogenase-like predicted oxidoreductase